MEQPEFRTDFRHPDLLAFVKRNRPLFVKAGITLVRAWQAAGCPDGTKTLGMFESWAQIVGGILDVAGIHGFLTNLDTLQAPDAETVAWSQFFTRWWTQFEDRVVGVSAVYRLINSGHAGPIDLKLAEGRERDEIAQKMVLGRRLSERRDRIIGGYRLIAAGTAQHAQQWRLEQVGEHEGDEDRNEHLLNVDPHPY
jgi:hypothetical protein